MKRLLCVFHLGIADEWGNVQAKDTAKIITVNRWNAVERKADKVVK